MNALTGRVNDDLRCLAQQQPDPDNTLAEILAMLSRREFISGIFLADRFNKSSGRNNTHSDTLTHPQLRISFDFINRAQRKNIMCCGDGNEYERWINFELVTTKETNNA